MKKLRLVAELMLVFGAICAFCWAYGQAAGQMLERARQHDAERAEMRARSGLR